MVYILQKITQQIDIICAYTISNRQSMFEDIYTDIYL